MSAHRSIVVASISLCVGWFGGLNTALSLTNGEPTDPAARSAVTPHAPCPTFASPTVAAQETRQAEAFWAAIDESSDPLSGPAPAWSESPGLQPDAVQSTLEEAFLGADVQLDCSEFPCIGVVEVGGHPDVELAEDLQANGIPREAYTRVGEQLSALGLRDMSVAVHQSTLEDGGHRVLVTWLSKERDVELGDRLQARFDWLAEFGASDADIAP